MGYVGGEPNAKTAGGPRPSLPNRATHFLIGPPSYSVPIEWRGWHAVRGGWGYRLVTRRPVAAP